MAGRGYEHGHRLGQGEAVNFPPPPSPRPKSRSPFQKEDCVEPGPKQQGNTLQRSLNAVEGDVNGTDVLRRTAGSAPIPPRRKLSKAFRVCIGLVAVLSTIGLILDYSDVWDPCSVKIPYQTQSTVNNVLGLCHQTFIEYSMCLVPGVFHSTQKSGWKFDCRRQEEHIINS